MYIQACNYVRIYYSIHNIRYIIKNIEKEKFEIIFIENSLYILSHFILKNFILNMK